MPSYCSLHFNSAPVADIDALIRSYETQEFNSPYRSTIPLLALLKEAGPAWSQIVDALRVGTDASVHCEYQVEVRRGRGKPSHTDLLIRSGEYAWAIEAKWTEPRYPTIAKWIAEAERPAPTLPSLARGGAEQVVSSRRAADVTRRRFNREQVANGWLDVIRERGFSVSDFQSAGGVVYQMLHRAASACAAGSRPALVYLVFGESADHLKQKDFYLRDLEAFHALLGRPLDFPFYLINVRLQAGTAFAAISKLKKGDIETGIRTRNALLSETLFAFDPPLITGLHDVFVHPV